MSAFTPSDTPPLSGELTPTQHAEELFEFMRESDSTMRTIIEETLDSAREGRLLESGRTVCGPNTTPKPPISRFPQAVDLRGCPRVGTGAFHTHASKPQLTDAEHSLPDLANVAFHDVTVSIVVGTRSAEVVFQATNDAAMRAAFREALGVQVDTTRDVARALTTGQITDPAAARERVRDAFGDCTARFRTDYDDLYQRLTESGDVPIGGVITDAAPELGQNAMHGPDAAGLRKQSREISRMMKDQMSDLGLKQEVVSQTVSVTVGTVVGNAVGGFFS